MTTENNTEEETLFEFPCEFPVKAMGKKEKDMETLVLTIVQNHAPEATAEDITTNLSKNGKYISVTVNITAQSKKQLDAIYMELTGHPDVLYAI